MLLLLLHVLLLVDELALAKLAVLDEDLIRNVLVDLAAFQLLADALVLLDAEAPLLLEELLDWLLLFLLDFHEDGCHQGQQNEDY